MKKPVKNVAQSVHDRLLALAKTSRRPFTEVLQLYAMERFLYRLAQSEHADKFVLKGGLMLRVWKAPVTRPTKDADLLGRTQNTVANLESIVRDVIGTEVTPDGLIFDAKTVAGSPIKEAAEYSGIRIKFIGRLQVARVSMQLDVGFGDVVTPAAKKVEVPTLLDFPAPKLNGYPRETAVAEKFHAMVILGTLNTRMKDFYDLWLLAQNFDFDRRQLSAAIRATFKARSTEPDLNPVALATPFAQSADAQRLWAAFLNKSGLTDAPTQFADVVAVVRSFVLPAVEGGTSGRWSAGAGWQ